MKVSGPNGVGPASGPRPARGGGAGFQVPTRGSPSGPGPATSVSGVANVMGVDALLALQDVGGPLERRKRAVKRASNILDVLDDLKLSLLAGEVEPGDLHRLKRAVTEARAATDDPQLEVVLEEIELRAAVEAAKLECATRST